MKEYIGRLEASQRASLWYLNLEDASGQFALFESLLKILLQEALVIDLPTLLPLRLLYLLEGFVHLRKRPLLDYFHKVVLRFLLLFLHRFSSLHSQVRFEELFR